MKTLQEEKEQPTRANYLKRIALELADIVPTGNLESFLFKYPLLEYVTDASQITLMSEFELLYWSNLIHRHLDYYSRDINILKSLNATMVRLLFF